MNLKDTLVELLEIMKIAAAPSFSSENSVVHLALLARCVEAFNALVIDPIVVESRIDEDIVILKQSVMVAVQEIIAGNKPEGIPKLMEAIQNAMLAADYMANPFFYMFPEKEGDFPLRDILADFNEWLMVAAKNNSTVLDNSLHLQEGQAILTAFEERCHGTWNPVPKCANELGEIMFNHHEHMAVQQCDGLSYTPMSLMEERGETWASSTKLIIEVGSLKPTEAQSEDAAQYKVALLGCVGAFISKSILPGVPQDIISSLQKNLVDHYMAEYAKNGNWLDKPVSEMTAFMESTIYLRMAATMKIGEHRKQVIKASYDSQMTTVLDGIMNMVPCAEADTGNKDDQDAVGRMMQLLHLANANTVAWENNIKISPSTMRMEGGLIRGIIKISRDLLNSNKVKDNTIRDLLGQAVMVVEAAVYSANYKSDAHSEAIKQEKYATVMRKVHAYIRGYFDMKDIGM